MDNLETIREAEWQAFRDDARDSVRTHGHDGKYLCATCGNAPAVCDDDCVTCWVNFLRANPDEYEPTESVWQLQHWANVARQFEQTREWQAHCDAALAMYEALADYQRSPHQYPTTITEYRALKGERVFS